eukprot:8055696-Alexandrium_andersonii.AAC.1
MVGTVRPMRPMRSVVGAESLASADRVAGAWWLGGRWRSAGMVANVFRTLSCCTLDWQGMLLLEFLVMAYLMTTRRSG